MLSPFCMNINYGIHVDVDMLILVTDLDLPFDLFWFLLKSASFASQIVYTYIEKLQALIYEYPPKP